MKFVSLTQRKQNVKRKVNSPAHALFNQPLFIKQQSYLRINLVSSFDLVIVLNYLSKNLNFTVLKPVDGAHPVERAGRATFQALNCTVPHLPVVGAHPVERAASDELLVEDHLHAPAVAVARHHRAPQPERDTLRSHVHDPGHEILGFTGGGVSYRVIKSHPICLGCGAPLADAGFLGCSRST